MTKRIHRGGWTVEAPQDPRDLYYVSMKPQQHRPGFSFNGDRREMVALRTALAAAILAPRKARP